MLLRKELVPSGLPRAAARRGASTPHSRATSYQPPHAGITNARRGAARKDEIRARPVAIISKSWGQHLNVSAGRPAHYKKTAPNLPLGAIFCWRMRDDTKKAPEGRLRSKFFVCAAAPRDGALCRVAARRPLLFRPVFVNPPQQFVQLVA
jgi:hypothetical protein